MVHYHQQLKNSIRKLKADPKVSAGNKRLIVKFRDELFSLGLGLRRILKYMQYLRRMARLLGTDFDQASQKDLKRLVHRIDRMESQSREKNFGGQVADWTKYDCKVMLKKFYKVMEGDNEEYPAKIKWLKPKLNVNQRKLPEELLTEKEVRAMVKAAHNIRDRALVSTLYESGCRIGELVALKVKHVQFDRYGSILLVPEGKTGARRIRLVTSTPYLSNWVSHHPRKKASQSPLWCASGPPTTGNASPRTPSGTCWPAWPANAASPRRSIPTTSGTAGRPISPIG